MGKRITIDSATLMNKGLEVIEAHWLFDLPPEQIDVMVHPQSMVHSMVDFADGSTIAQLGTADMRIPIQYALTIRNGCITCCGLGLEGGFPVRFMPTDRKKFPCIAPCLSGDALGGTAPAVVNAADEIAGDGVFRPARFRFRYSNNN